MSVVGRKQAVFQVFIKSAIEPERMIPNKKTGTFGKELKQV